MIRNIHNFKKREKQNVEPMIKSKKILCVHLMVVRRCSDPKEVFICISRESTMEELKPREMIWQKA